MTSSESGLQRLRLKNIISYIELVKAHARVFWPYYVAPIAFVLVFNHFAIIGINVTRSLPYHVFLTLKAPHEPKKGEMLSFVWQGGGPYPKGLIFTKIVAGVPGDRVTRKERTFYVNGIEVGIAKPFSTTGIPLKAGPEGIIPAGHYYVMTAHPDSLDSRYALTGWISQESVVGRAIGLF